MKKILFFFFVGLISINSLFSQKPNIKSYYNKFCYTKSFPTLYTNSIGNQVIFVQKNFDLTKKFGLLQFFRPMFNYYFVNKKVPIDFMLLPIIESSLNPHAHSSAGAIGIWQFMPKTGKNFGLNKTSTSNDFKNYMKATESASKYLAYLYSIFKDWRLVVMAYNAGEGRVLGAIKKAESKDPLAIINYLPKETQTYYNRFNAIRFVYKHYVITKKPIKVLNFDFRNISSIKINSNTNFKTISKQFNTPLNILRFINPHIESNSIILPNSIIFIVKTKI